MIEIPFLFNLSGSLASEWDAVGNAKHIKLSRAILNSSVIKYKRASFSSTLASHIYIHHKQYTFIHYFQQYHRQQRQQQQHHHQIDEFILFIRVVPSSTRRGDREKEHNTNSYGWDIWIKQYKWSGTVHL